MITGDIGDQVFASEYQEYAQYLASFPLPQSIALSFQEWQQLRKERAEQEIPDKAIARAKIAANLYLPYN